MLTTCEAKYAIEQVILRAPKAIPRMMLEIEKHFPQYKEYAEQLLVLV